MKIKNVNYRQFLDSGMIEPIKEDKLKLALDNIKAPYRELKRALLIVLYLTGCRPIEALNLKGKDVVGTNDNNVSIKLYGAKRGLSRVLNIPIHSLLAKELLQYSKTMPPEAYLFYYMRGSYPRKTKKGIRYDVSTKLRWHLARWFKDVIPGGITPYYLRHNAFSLIANDGSVSMFDLRLIKGTKREDSISAYVHLSEARSKKLGKVIAKMGK